MKITSVEINNYKKCITVYTRKGHWDLPYTHLDISPTPDNKIKEIFVDPELGKEAITYELESGDQNSVHLDVFMDYNKDPDFLKKLFLFELTIEAQRAIESTSLSKNEVCRRLKTSPSQLARLLDQTNTNKSVDKMLSLLAVLGISVRPHFQAA